MYKKTMLILCALIVSSACLSTTAIQSVTLPAPVTVPAVTLSATTTSENKAVELQPTETAMPTCGTITAAKAVNLRELPTEHSRVIFWLPAFTQVTVIERGEWWQVTAGEHSGYVKADYIKECE